MTESQHLEWKESWRDEYLKWICAFANSEGGVLIIGKNDQGEAVGVKDAKKLLEDLPNKIRDLLGILVDVNLLEENKQQVIEIVTLPYPTPISYRGRYYQRSGSTLQELKGAALDRFLLRKQGRTWDSVPMPGFALEDLSQTSIQNFRELAARNGRVESAFLKGGDAVLIEKLPYREQMQIAEKTSVKTSVKTAEALLTLLQKNPSMTLDEAAKTIERSTRTIEMASSKLVKIGKLEFVGPQRGGYWKILPSNSK